MKIAPLAVMVTAIGLFALGCSNSAPTPPPKTDEISGKSTPEAGGGQMALESSPDDKAKLDKLQKEYDAAKSALAKSPNDAKVKEHFSSIGALYGDESMKSPVLDRKVKYRQALQVFREVLKVDPTNPVAKGESDMIVKIYQSMGRPVPN